MLRLLETTLNTNPTSSLRGGNPNETVFQSQADRFSPNVSTFHPLCLDSLAL